MKIDVVKFDNNGRGIGYFNDKIIFIPKTVPGDVVNCEIVLEKKNYMEGKLIEIIKPSKLRKEAICPYFNTCGGCQLMHISLSEMLEYKLNKVNELLEKNNIDYQVKDIIKSDNIYNYRNKVTFKIINGKLGFYEHDTHKLVETHYCYLCNKVINDLLKDISLLNIQNGELVIRCNYNNELLLSIKTDDKIENIVSLEEKHKIVGVVKNDQVIYGQDFLIDNINDLLFKISYNSFFQVNPYICAKLFNLINDYISSNEKVMDLYCGVGTLSINSSIKSQYVLGVEIVENAIKDANLNKLLNNKNNVDFVCDDTRNILDKITNDFDTIILDPPRNGVSSKLIEKILEVKTSNIIYVSCNPITLIRDLKLLVNNYNIIEFKLLDMFPNTEHVESIVYLKIKN